VAKEGYGSGADDGAEAGTGFTGDVDTIAGEKPLVVGPADVTSVG